MELVQDLLFTKRSLHVFETSKVQLVNAHWVVLEFYSKIMDHENHLATVVKEVCALLICI